MSRIDAGIIPSLSRATATFDDLCWSDSVWDGYPDAVCSVPEWTDTR